MAISNVRFYKLATLPNFEAKHQGIFVHVTSNLTRTINEGNYNYSWGELDSKVIQQIVIQKIGERSILVPEWMNVRRIDTVESGLWFGGENGWELLSNDTNSIDAAINAKIQGLDVPGYVQATITPDTPAEGVPNSSTLTIKGIQEVDGRIGIPADSENLDLDIAIDGVYSQSNKIATKSTVTKAIEALDVNTAVQAVTFNTPENSVNTVLTFNGIKEVDGKIVEGNGTDTFTVGDAKLKIQIGSATATDVFSANAQSDSTIKLDGYVFRKDENNVISVITPTAVSSSNRLVTEQDIASINGAMHYQGPIANADAWPSTTPKKGDVYIATGDFEKDRNIIQSGDMIVFGDNGSFTVVQSNITLGIGDGQIAKNVGALANGNLVVATENGIKTTNISATVLEDANNTRNLTYSNVAGGISITDSLKIMNRNFNESINITSTNRSIKIAANASENATNVVLDLVWNTTIE